MPKIPNHHEIAYLFRYTRNMLSAENQDQNQPGQPNQPDDALLPTLTRVLESAARLQELVPDTVLVGGTAVAYYARRRLSFDHDHVLGTLSERFDAVFEALDRESDFVLNRAVPGKIILGELGGIEVGVRQLIRKLPLEVQKIRLPSGHEITVPTEAELVRIKAYLIVKRNQVRDYLDVGAMSSKYGPELVARWLLDLDEYYADDSAPPMAVLSQLLKQLAVPSPRDSRTTARLDDYKGLSARWSDWGEVVAECQMLSAEIMRQISL